MTNTKTENEKLVTLLIEIALRNKVALQNYTDGANIRVCDLLRNLFEVGLLSEGIYLKALNTIQ
ncbi:hypothetical protein V4V35_23915 [Bacillus infantis]|uniref:hypothetical protein n=1 Tax=Bacillus infantis TaxID=324767 RepID=UPI002FBE5E65